MPKYQLLIRRKRALTPYCLTSRAVSNYWQEPEAWMDELWVRKGRWIRELPPAGETGMCDSVDLRPYRLNGRAKALAPM